MFRIPWLLLLFVFTAGARVHAAADPNRALLDAEETYELRLQRLMQQKGMVALGEYLKQDEAARPLPYVKAWYANCLLYGAELGMPGFADPKRGFLMAQEAREAGSPYGLELVGRAYGDGRGIERNVTVAVFFLGQAVARGRSTAMCELSKYCFFGLGVPPDRTKAVELARRAAWQGATAGLLNLAGWWLDPKLAGSADLPMALRLYHEAGIYGEAAGREFVAQQAREGNGLAQRLLKLDYVVGAREGAVARPAELKATVKWLEANSSADDWEVQIPIAELMIERRSPLYDAAEARRKLTQAAAAGQLDAAAILADMAFRGIGQKADPAAAIAAWQKLAARDNARALNALGTLAWWGEGEKYGLKKDAAQAFALCRRAADLGYWSAEFNTADCYVHGIGTEQNYALAARYYEVLELRGYFRARRLKDSILALVHD